MRHLLLSIFLLSGASVMAADIPSWLKGWKVKGDLRVRYEYVDSDKEDKEDRSRGRFRLRLSADRKISDKLTFKSRLATGGGATSTNQTFDSSFDGKDIFVDRAFFTYKTDNNWVLGAGRYANPFHSKDIVWDTDVNLEGAYAQMGGDSFYLTVGGSVLEEESSGPDSNMGALQLGYKAGDSVKFNGSLAYYAFEAVGDNYTFIDALVSLSWKDTPFSLNLDYVSNTTSGIDSDDTAYAAYLAYGKAKKPGEWAFSLKYASVEAYSSATAFADSDFGFGDKEGFQFNAKYRASKHMTWRAGLFDVEGINDEDSGFTRVQIDCAIKF